MPCSRKSCWRQSHGVGTSDTIATFNPVKSANRKLERSRFPTRKNGARAATSKKQTSGGSGRRRGAEQLNSDTLAGVEPKRVRGIEWRVKHRAKILRELDAHGQRYSGRAAKANSQVVLDRK